jgi:DNA-binding NarL/FixJ family response regulator
VSHSPQGKPEEKKIMSGRKSRQPRPTLKRVLIVDDHPMTRYGIAQLLQREPNLEVCGESETAAQALPLVKSLKPDLVVTDLAMPGKHGLEFIKDLRAMHPEVAVLVISMHDETLYAERVLNAGGRGYVMKHAGGEELLQAVRCVLSGHIYLGDSMTREAIDSVIQGRSKSLDPVIGKLTDRELHVFQCLGQGMTTREIGAHLHMSVKTVETHRRHLREKLNISTGPGLIQFAVRWMSAQQTS